MATKAEIRDQYLKRLRDEIQRRKEELDRLRGRLRLAQLEDDAQATLTPEDVAILRSAALIDKDDASTVQASISDLQTQIDALQRLIDAARAVA
jgi:ribosomal protein L29